jgi:excinuclease ABC subunit A
MTESNPPRTPEPHLELIRVHHTDTGFSAFVRPMLYGARHEIRSAKDPFPAEPVTCDVCGGRRYNRETLAIRYKGRNIDEVLQMSVTEASEFFTHVPQVARRLGTLQDVGLGYLRLGQSALTLSGGEAQRVKLSLELSRRDTGRTVYLLDEPTTGLHFVDVRQLLAVLQRLIDKGNTVVVIEHHLDVIKQADHVIDLGPEGGSEGGDLVATGTPEQVAGNEASHTGRYLREVL